LLRTFSPTFIEGLSKDHSGGPLDRNGYGTLPPGASKIDQYARHGEEHTKFWARFQIRLLILLDNSLSAQSYLITQIYELRIEDTTDGR
jgi:hypothetical protein